MGDNGSEIKKETSQEQPLLQMMIIFNPNNGQVQVTGPLNNRTLAYGMLEMAREAIYELKEKMKPQIQIPKHGIMDFVRRK